MNVKLLQQGLVCLLALSLGAATPAYSETLALNTVAPARPTDGYAMMGLGTSMSIVEQLQTIHRYSQSSSPKAIMGLISALSSPFPLARRKASRSLLEKARSAEDLEKKVLVEKLEGALDNPDPVVQKNIIRLMASINLPEAQKALSSFFKASNKASQLSAVNALSLEETQSKTALDLAKQVSPYSEVRQAAQESLK